MRVAFFIPSLRGGGAERMFVLLATKFSELGWKVDMVLLNSSGMEYVSDLSPVVRVIDLGVPRLWTGFPAYWKYLINNCPDVVISAMPLANGIAAWAKRLSKIPHKLVLTEHNAVSIVFGDLDIPRYRPLLWVIRPSYHFADALVGVSDGVKERLKTIPMVDPDKVHRIYNPAWSQIMEERSHEKLPEISVLAQNNCQILLAAGRMEIQKDFRTLLNAFALLRQRCAVQLVILGDGSLRRDLEKQVVALGVGDHVLMPGFQENPFAWYAMADVFVMSSIHEGFGNVLVEAMACGTPVVSTDCPSGPAEILEYGRYGSLVPVGDHYALANAIESQINNPTPADLLRDRARDFSVEISASDYMRLIDRLRKAG